MTLKDFSILIGKRNKPRKHKVKNSLGLAAAYKYYKNNSTYNISRTLFSYIIRRINLLLIDKFLLGHDILFPYHMGKLCIIKFNNHILDKNGNIKLKVDWNKTLKMWYEDKESFENKSLYRFTPKQIFRIYYEPKAAHYNNKTFYKFLPNREFKKRFKEKVINRELDGFKTY